MATGNPLTDRVRTVAELLRTRAADQPDRLGYTFLADGETGELPLTYAEADRRARAVAGALRAAGARPGMRALLVLPPGLDYVTTLFGCLYAGVVAVPVYPPDPFQLERSLPRLLAIVDDAEPTVALTTAPLLGFLDEVSRLAPALGALRWVAVDTVDEAADDEPVAVAPEATALLQYTSGSTADPRGVLLSHANLLHNSAHIQRLFRTTTDSHGMVWLPPYHDMGLIGGLLQPLYGGFPVTLMSPLHFLEQPMRWLRAIARHGATASGGPNFAYDLCARRCGPDEAERLDLSTWQVAFNGAEPIRPETLERFAATFAPSGFRADAFLPCYGLAEATLIVTGHGGRGAGPSAPPVVPVDRAALEQHVASPPTDAATATRLTSCGPSHPDQRLAIVDPATSTASAPGRVGEIWVSGPSVAAGYWRRPEESARVFDARLAGDDATPYLRTGDLGFLHDGQLVVTGRLKDLVIVRGQNHYPQDIELSVERADPSLRPGCGAAFVVADDEGLVVAHEVRRGATVVVADVAARIRQAVALEHGLDVHTVVLVQAGGMPKTSSGKVQRRLCRARYLAGDLPEVGRAETPAEPADDAAPVAAEQVLAAPEEARRALLERYLAGLLVAITGTAPADRLAPLLAIGLDSLAVVQLKHRVETDLQVDLSLPALLGGASLAEAADQLDEQLVAGPAPRPPAAAKGAGDGVAPMAYGQRWMWYLHSLEPASPAYTIAVALRLLDPVDPATLRRALDALVARHPALRTTFQVRDGEPVQVVAPTGTAAFREHAATSLDDATLRAVLTRAARAPFDLATGPLFRVDLYRRRTDDVLLVSMHHIVTDFWSLTVLARELGELYGAHAESRGHSLAEPAATYAEAVEWQRSLLDDPVAGRRLSSYWDGQVDGGLPRLALPPVDAGGGDGVRQFALPAALTGRLRERAAATNVTLYMLLLAAFQAVLHRHTGQADLVVGADVAGRGQPRFADVVGCFTNPVILRSRSVPGEPFRAVLGRTRERVIGALEHQDYPMMLLASRGKIPRRGPLFDVLFTFNQSPRHGDDLAALVSLGRPGILRTLGALRVEGFPLPPARSALKIELMMAEVDGVPHGLLRYHADALDDAAAERLVNAFVELLDVVAADPDRPVSEPAVSPA
ncbi:condensation domain-containing protein [Asanoa sp. NPDC049518]|uniref:condensation domain-containing protein n=1 Tax=unclassified Asanoa TaxID=2685164 RepID=UPI003418B1B6